MMMMMLLIMLMMGMITCPALTTSRVGFSLRSSGPAPPLRSLFLSSFQHHFHCFHDCVANCVLFSFSQVVKACCLRLIICKSFSWDSILLCKVFSHFPITLNQCVGVCVCCEEFKSSGHHQDHYQHHHHSHHHHLLTHCPQVSVASAPNFGEFVRIVHSSPEP